MNFPLVQSVGIVVLDGENVLLVRHGKDAHHYEGVIGLPSGKIDPGETAIQAAQRELHEETGLSCEMSDLIPLPKTYQAMIEQKDGIKIFDWHVYWCREYSGELHATSETEPFWTDQKELAGIKLLPNVANAIDEAIKLRAYI